MRKADVRYLKESAKEVLYPGCMCAVEAIKLIIKAGRFIVAATEENTSIITSLRLA